MTDQLGMLLRRVEAKLQILDDDRTLSNLSEVYPTLIALADDLERDFPMPLRAEADDVAIFEFIAREQARVKAGGAPVWRLENVTARLVASGNEVGEAYVMSIALVPIGENDADVRDVLRTWFSRYGVPAASG